MADARKRARRPGAKGSRKPPAPADVPTDRTADVSPRADAPEAAPAGERIEQPPSGLAEDVLASSPEPTAAGREDAAAGRIELPSSGLAADVLAQPEAAAISPTPAAGHAAEPTSEATSPDAVGQGAQSLSFFAAPALEQREAAEATEHLATFLLDREGYGGDVRQVQEIRRVGEITAVPRAPEFVRGVINLRGRILPVLDLKRKLGLGEVAVERAARIVVVRVQDRLLGLLVDGASQVLKVPVSRVEPPPEEVVERGGDYIRGVAKLEDRLIILIDLGRVLVQELREAPAAAGA
jgi:purine-binding chemotaxis protein CheW